MEPIEQSYPRKRARLRRANDGFWTPGMGDPVASSTSIAPQATSTRSSPFAAPSPRQSKTFVTSLIQVYLPSTSVSADGLRRSSRLESRSLPVDSDSFPVPVKSSHPSSPIHSQTQTQLATEGSPTNVAPASRALPQAASANSSPKAQAVIGESTSPFWSNAGGIFHPDAQNPVAVSSADAQALQQLPGSAAGQANINTPAFSGISALVFDPADLQPTVARNPTTVPSSPSPTLRRAPALSQSLATPSVAPTSRITNSPPSVSSAPNTLTETRSTIATSSSLLLTTALASASSSSLPSTSSSQFSTSSTVPASASASPTASPSTNFLSTLSSSPVNITITVLVCVGILALLIAFLFIFIRRCQRRRKKRRMGDFLGSEFDGSPGLGGFGILRGGGGGGSTSEWNTPGPGWTEKYYGEQVGGRMIGGGGGGGRISSSSRDGGDELEHWQRHDLGMTGMEGGYGVARTLSQERRTSEWANYRGPDDFDPRSDSWDEGRDAGGLVNHTHVLEYGSNGYEASNHQLPPPPPPPAAIRPRSERDFAIDRLAPPLATSSRPRPAQQPSYSSYASESMYPVDEIGDIEAEKKELSETMSALNLGGGGEPNRRDNSGSPPAQTSWRDSLDWVMGSAADLIGSKFLARGGSADTLVASPPEKSNEGDDRFTQRPPSIRIPRNSVDPRAIPDQFTPLSPSYGDRFLNPPSQKLAPVSADLSRQSSMISFTSSANFATTTQQGTFAQSARSRLFDAALAKHAQDEDEMKVLDDIAAMMMSRQTTSVTVTTDQAPEIPYPQFDPTPLNPTRRFVASPVDMSRSSTASTSSSFTYRPTPSPPQHHLDLSPSSEMHRRDFSASSMGSKASFDAFGRGLSTPREYPKRSSLSRQKTTRSRKSKNNRMVQGGAPAMGIDQSMTSISTFEALYEDEDFETRRKRWERDEKVKELMVERRRRSEEFEESLV